MCCSASRPPPEPGWPDRGGWSRHSQGHRLLYPHCAPLCLWLICFRLGPPLPGSFSGWVWGPRGAGASPPGALSDPPCQPQLPEPSWSPQDAPEPCFHMAPELGRRFCPRPLQPQTFWGAHAPPPSDMQLPSWLPEPLRLPSPGGQPLGLCSPPPQTPAPFPAAHPCSPPRLSWVSPPSSTPWPPAPRPSPSSRPQVASTSISSDSRVPLMVSSSPRSAARSPSACPQGQWTPRAATRPVSQAD